MYIYVYVYIYIYIGCGVWGWGAFRPCGQRAAAQVLPCFTGTKCTCLLVQKYKF